MIQPATNPAKRCKLVQAYDKAERLARAELKRRYLWRNERHFRAMIEDYQRISVMLSRNEGTVPDTLPTRVALYAEWILEARRPVEIRAMRQRQKAREDAIMSQSRGQRG